MTRPTKPPKSPKPPEPDDHDNAFDYEFVRILPDGVMLACYRTVFGNGRLIISPSRYDSFIAGSWCYPSLTDAAGAMSQWDNPRIGPGERPPDGWFREVHTGRRRENGDPEKETFQP